MTTACERIQSHLSALADGELQPIEAIAVRRHLSACPGCQRTFEGLESLKLAVHLAGSEPQQLTDAQHDRLLRAVREHAESQRVDAARRTNRWMVPLAAAAAVVLTVATMSVLQGPLGPADRAAATQAPAQPAAVLDESALSRMARVHRGLERPEVLDDLVQVGALLTFEGLPGTFITPEGERSRVVHASFLDCDGSVLGSSLAVLRLDHVTLPAEIRAALAATGVYVDVVDGIDVRVSTSGERVFVLLSEVDPFTGGSSI